MDIRHLRGSIVALVTPFHADGSVNFEKLRELVEWHIASGTDAILTLGTTGESSTMTHEEDDDTLRCVVASAAGCVPVIAGTGSNCTQTMVEKSLRAQELGADGLLLITPYYNKANQEGMYRHFAAVADAVTIPSILYNVPGRTGCAIAPETVERLRSTPTSAASRRPAATCPTPCGSPTAWGPISPSGPATTTSPCPCCPSAAAASSLCGPTSCPGSATRWSWTTWRGGRRRPGQQPCGIWT